ARGDVLLEPEEVVRVVSTLDLDESRPDSWRVCVLDPLGTFVTEEVDVGAASCMRCDLLEQPPRPGQPDLVIRGVGPVTVDIDHELGVPMRVGRQVVLAPRDCSAGVCAQAFRVRRSPALNSGEYGIDHRI